MRDVLDRLATAVAEQDTTDAFAVAQSTFPFLRPRAGVGDELAALAVAPESDIRRVSDSRFSARVERYLRSLPESIRHAWMRPQDPLGVSPPHGFALTTPYDLLKLLPESVEPPPVTSARLGSRVELRLPSGDPMRFAWCPPGRFRMGSETAVRLDTKDVPHHFEWELPVHPVTLTRGFYAATHAVTRGNFAAFVSETGYRSEAETGGGGWRWEDGRWVQDSAVTWRTPGYAQDDDHPVSVVSWNDARAFSHWVRASCGRPARLPTEAEWEYACRAGGTAEYHFGDVPNTDMLNYDGDYSWNGSPTGEFRRRTTPVGSFPPNRWGLFDMHGNVWEWCADWFDPTFYARSPELDPVCRDAGLGRRVYRGGSWFNNPVYCRAAYRHSLSPGHRHNYLGFRVVFAVE